MWDMLRLGVEEREKSRAEYTQTGQLGTVSRGRFPRPVRNERGEELCLTPFARPFPATIKKYGLRRNLYSADYKQPATTRIDRQPGWDEGRIVSSLSWLAFLRASAGNPNPGKPGRGERRWRTTGAVTFRTEPVS